MERHGVVDGGADSRFSEGDSQSFAIRSPDYIKMINGASARQLVWQHTVFRTSAEEVAIFRCVSSPLNIPVGKMLEFHRQDAGLNGVQPSVVSHKIVIVLSRLAVVANHLDSGSNFLVVGGHGAGFSTGSEVFAGIKAESGGEAHGSGFLPAI